MSSGNIFQDVLTSANKVQDDLLGPTYKYYNNINSPSAIGMSSKGDLNTLSKDVSGLISYVQILVEGTGKASKTGSPLGNKFFLKTGAKCTDNKNNTIQDRYIYVNNVPTGNIPFISSAMGTNFKNFRGLIPGALSDLNAINPFSMMQSFLGGSTPPCQKITMETIDVNNKRSSETHYTTVIDIQNMDPCNFSNGINPITSVRCNLGGGGNSSSRQGFSIQQSSSPRPAAIGQKKQKKQKKPKKVVVRKKNKKRNKQAFQNLYDDEEVLYDDEELKMPKDKLIQFYFFGLSILGVYILYRIGTRKMG